MKQPRRAADVSILSAVLRRGLATLIRHLAASAAVPVVPAVVAIAASAALRGVTNAARLTSPASTPRGLRIGGFLQLRLRLDGTAFCRDRDLFVMKFGTFPCNTGKPK
ncbi:hypothetical protein GCM10022419_017080 [Nonomuraea rosea]|uniref:Secreted protein n=1 Tax=Nonomuraea rosea TaxID=638574 RepID=A0ABP6VMI5_9ACTN